MTEDLELLQAVHELVNQFAVKARAEHGSIPPVGSAEWFTAPPVAQVASLLVCGEAYVLRTPAEIAGDMIKDASVAISLERIRLRELTRQRREDIGDALRRGDGELAYALTVHHASDQWWLVEVAS